MPWTRVVWVLRGGLNVASRRHHEGRALRSTSDYLSRSLDSRLYSPSVTETTEL